jgi:tRNA-dihydrouridine synthase B
MNSSRFIKRLRAIQFMLPPLTGYTDYPYRIILAAFNPPFLTTEMINARALIHKNPRTLQMIQRVSQPIIQGVQLLGKEPTSMAQAAKIIEELGFDYIDINMGCTIKKVTSRGEGVALMNDEQAACATVTAVSHAVDLPVTVKLRIGSSKKSINVSTLSQKLVDAGAIALTVHGRTGEKKFTAHVDLSTIKEVVRCVSAPIIANGGIFNGHDAQHMLHYTGAAAVMPGRGLIGNPWLVSELTYALSGKTFSSPTIEEKKKICLNHTEALCNHYGERTGIIHMRKILPKYFPQLLYLKNLKHDVNAISTIGDTRMILNRIIERDTQWCYVQNKSE